ncbi:insulin receptor-like protein [Euroglyphus maynei]|uniref:Insulin receptor-like protein n=1 Tax=Euroglyphus maynei TaxID=6958 RepID=A0A1Y3BJ33_EURMA|nr:insulin receptor-like protein [Euroglyphus maynei]
MIIVYETVCESTRIDNIASAQALKGCTKINGSLEIYINDQDSQIVQELHEYLKDLVEITGYLRIARSFPLITLNFLRNLKLIRGDTLERNIYSLLIFDNPNLQDLWPFKSDEFLVNGDEKRIRILRGQIFVHLNPKLCYQRILSMIDYVDGLHQPWDERDVSSHSNGDKVPCNVTVLDVRIKEIGPVMVIIEFENFANKMEDQRSLVGYLIYTREAEHRNVTIFDGVNACSNNEWTVREYDAVENDNNTYHEHLITNFKPFTQYALYIKTYTINTVNKGAQSEIKYFITKPDSK